MKRHIPMLITGLALTVIAFVAPATYEPVQAQTVPVDYQMSNWNDTAVNTTPLSLDKRVTGGYSQMSVQFVGEKIDGTVGGIAVLRSCNDGVNFTPHFGTSADTFTLTNIATQSKTWDIGPQSRSDYQVYIVPTGTMRVKTRGIIKYWK